MPENVTVKVSPRLQLTRSNTVATLISSDNLGYAAPGAEFDCTPCVHLWLPDPDDDGFEIEIETPISGLMVWGTASDQSSNGVLIFETPLALPGTHRLKIPPNTAGYRDYQALIGLPSERGDPVPLSGVHSLRVSVRSMAAFLTGSR